MHVVSEDHAINQSRRERAKYFAFTAFCGIALLFNVTGWFDQIFGVDTAILIALLAGYQTFYRAIAELLEKRLSADLAIVIAAIAAFSVGEYAAAAEAMFIMLVGESLEAWAAGRTEAAIHRFVEQLPHHARVIRDGRETEIDVEDLVADDIVVVRAGERVPADGSVETGETSIDESPITGESMPRDKAVGDAVYAGTINGHGRLQVRVTEAGEDSTLARVIHLVEHAREHKAPVVRLADRYARYFLPAILGAAGLVYWLSGDVDARERTLRAVTVLIVGCPCALILATPAAMVAGIGGLARRGILARNGTALQNGAKVDTVVFDKTGTLTSGEFEVLSVVPADGFDEEDVLRLAASAESGSDHPLARKIVAMAKAEGIDFRAAAEARILAGRGAECVLDGKTVRAGNAAFLDSAGVRGTETLVTEADRLGATPVLVSRGEQLAGAIFLRDNPREGAAQAVHDLSEMGITNIYLLTGDRRRAAEAIAREVGIPNVEAELLPEDKLARIRQLQSQGRKVAMIGDGVNDAPALAAADVGIAVAGSGADIAAEAADIVDLNPSLAKLPILLGVTRKTVNIVWENIIIFAGVVNAVAVYIAGIGAIGPAAGAAFHQVASLLVMLNSVRLLKVERPRGRDPWWTRLWRGTGIPRMVHRAMHWLGDIHPASALAWLWDHRRKIVRPAMIGIAAVWILSGIYVLGPSESGVVRRFGKKLTPYREAGLHYRIPWPVDSLQRIEAKQIRTLEIGFRTLAESEFTEPPAYEWNVQHIEGRYQPVPEESIMLTGDQNMVELTAAVHYSVTSPDDFLFQHANAEATLRAAAESVLQLGVNRVELDDLFTTGRIALESELAADLRTQLDRYETGIEVLHLRLLEVHPSVEVVDAFREVAGALEEKFRLMNEAEGYANEQVALARGEAQAMLQVSEGYSDARKNRAAGDAARFTLWEAQHRRSPRTSSTRLYLETVEEVFAGREKLIVDAGNGRRNLYQIDDGVVFAPSGAAMTQPPPPLPIGPEED